MSREWFCVLTIKGKNVNGQDTTSTIRGKWVMYDGGTAMGLFEKVLSDAMPRSSIVDKPVVTFWYTAPEDLGSAS